MIAPLLFAAILSWSATVPDSSGESTDPSPQTPRSKDGKADSAWNREAWSVEAGYRSGIGWGDLREAEADMADRIDLRVTSMGQTSRPVILLQDYALGIGFWHGLGKRLELGFAFDQTWTLINAGQNSIDILLSSHSLSARGRYWAFRRLQWQIGPKLEIGPCWATLTRYAIEKSASYSGTAEEIATAKSILGRGNDDLSATGLRVAGGLAMEVRIVPAFSIGGALQAVRQGLSISDDDPVGSQLEAIGLPYPMDPVQWEVGLELHAAYRF